jgi:hypothetical protein
LSWVRAPSATPDESLHIVCRLFSVYALNFIQVYWFSKTVFIKPFHHGSGKNGIFGVC